jgi:hypothetical protein
VTADPFQLMPAWMLSIEKLPAAGATSMPVAGALTSTEAAGSTAAAACPDTGAVNSVTAAVSPAGPAAGASVAPTCTPSVWVTPSAATPRTEPSVTADVAFGVNSGTAQVLVLPLVVVLTVGAVTPSSPARCTSHCASGGGSPATSARSQLVSACASLASAANGKAGSDPSRPSSGIRCVATASASAAAVPDAATSVSLSRIRPRISVVASLPRAAGSTVTSLAPLPSRSRPCSTTCTLAIGGVAAGAKTRATETPARAIGCAGRVQPNCTVRLSRTGPPAVQATADMAPPASASTGTSARSEALPVPKRAPSPITEGEPASSTVR